MAIVWWQWQHRAGERTMPHLRVPRPHAEHDLTLMKTHLCMSPLMWPPHSARRKRMWSQCLHHTERLRAHPTGSAGSKQW
eukprot:3819798-Amphidinium_carterae.1